MAIDYKKQYWVYVITEYYPAGGVQDLEDTYDNLPDAEAIYHKWATKDGYEVSIWDMNERKELKNNH